MTQGLDETLSKAFKVVWVLIDWAELLDFKLQIYPKSLYNVSNFGERGIIVEFSHQACHI